MPGGVCAVLDYEVELMAEYVAEMSVRLALGTSVAPATFRKFISQILSSTRLPSTTILLGMNYLAKRINMLGLNGQRPKISEGQVWRMVTIALLLGSKFLDDNTFQNRSWADVSGIHVRELNQLELEWMNAISWRLYVNLDLSEDYKAWLKSWEDWSESKKRQQAIARDRMTGLITPPLETDVTRARWHQQQVTEYERLSAAKHRELAQAQPVPYRPRESSWSYQPQMCGWPSDPLTPPDSGYGTPDYLNSATSVNSQYDDWFSQQAQQASRAMVSGGYTRQPQQQYQASTGHSNSYQSSRNAPSYPAYNFYGHNIWEHNIVDCNCAGCASGNHQKHVPYFGVAQSYGQPVMG